MRTLPIILCLILLVSPAMGYSYSYNCSADKAIEIFQLETPGDNTGTIEFYQEDGNTISADFSYQFAASPLPVPMTGTASIGGSSDASYTFFTGGNLVVSVWPLTNISNTNRVKIGIGQASGLWPGVTLLYVSSAETSMTPSPIIGYTVTSDNPVATDELEIPRASVQAGLNTNSDDIFNQLKSYWDTFWGIFLGAMWWLKFLFVDNLMLLIVLYMTGTMAYEINKARNIFDFFKRWFKLQASLFHFMVNMFGRVVEMITALFNAITKWV